MKRVSDAGEHLTINAAPSRSSPTRLLGCTCPAVGSLWAGWAGSQSHHCKPDWPLLYLSSSPSVSALPTTKSWKVGNT